MYDTAIIGTGPAALSAAMNLKLHNKEIITLGAANYSTKVEKSEKIANYPGLGFISGKDLVAKFDEHAKAMDIQVTEQMVTAIMPMGDTFMLSAGTEVYTARTILLATGVAAGKGFAGEEELLGRGVSYCATCDGFLYKGKTIAAFCGDPRFEHEVEYLAEMADKVYLATSYKDVKADKPNIIKLEKPIRKILGDGKANGIELTDGSTIDIDGIFCLRNSIAPSTLMSGLELDGVHIVTDRSMATNIPGCFAAGDCTGRPYQIAKAVGEGNIAAHSIIEYIAARQK
ncbi:MAG: NAD(P)/FAD-dependent oxidoreductase [Clostridiales bacterium]|nr:NAD(P)/FAD-dependent oxidoreductase [Clostridiales bacterium]